MSEEEAINVLRNQDLCCDDKYCKCCVRRRIDCAHCVNEALEIILKENEQLKELCNKYEEEHKTTFETWLKDLARRKQAIDYITENAYTIQDKKINGIQLMSLRLDNCYDLLEILGDGINE